MRLYSYFRSSASYRLRIALNLKGLPYEYLPIHLVRNGGEQFTQDYRALNPHCLVPTLVLDSGEVLSQSLAIIEYLDEVHPAPPLLPPDPLGRARARALTLAVACEVHPLNNLRVLTYLSQELGVPDDAKKRWYHHWVETGFGALEQQLPQGTRYCLGETPSLVDICLIPQVFNALRFKVELERFPRIAAIYRACLDTDAFAKAAPEAQPDAE